MEKDIHSILAVFPTPNIEETARFYHEVMGFTAVNYLSVKEPHICLYRDDVEIVLTEACSERVYTNRELYGYGEDAYFVADDLEALQEEFAANGANIVRPLQLTDYITIWNLC